MHRIEIRYMTSKIGIPLAATTAAIIVLAVFVGTRNVSASPSKPQGVTAGIAVVPSSDRNHNGQLDPGETGRFTFHITNPTSTYLKLAKLNTNVATKNLLIVTQLHGTPSLDYSGKYVALPNIRIAPNQDVTVYFDAIMQSTTADAIVTAQPVLLNSDGRTLASGPMARATLHAGKFGAGSTVPGGVPAVSIKKESK